MRLHHPLGGKLIICERMKVLHHALQSLFENMRIDLRCRDVGVAEKRLHDAQIGAGLQQMTRERVPQHMRTDGFRRQPRSAGEFLEFARCMLPRQVTAFAERRKQPFRFRLIAALRDQRQVLAHDGACRRVQRDEALAVSLASHHQHPLVAVGGR